jgi:hypothetical protein
MLLQLPIDIDVMDTSFTEFTTDLIKRRTHKTMKVTNSFGVYDAYKHIRKNGWYDIGRPLKEGEFYKIVRGVNDGFAKMILNGDTVVFPSRMGKLELRKFEKGVSIVDGKLKITYPINWEETMKLWYADEQARKDKVLLRRENKYVYNVRYCKYDANYENKCFYEFTLNRDIKKELKKRINNGEIDTLW